MVGVPGRSKACNTCRLRKVACSLEKPECRTCIKASRICAGYQRERVFVLGPGTTYQAPKNSKPKSYINGDRELSIRRKKSADLIQKTESDDSEDSIQSTAIVKIRSPSPNAVYRQQILNEYIAYTLPSSWGTQYRGKNNGNWLVMLPALPNVTAALESSILAVSTAKLGRLGDNEVLIRESLKFYVQGLWELQKALWDPKLMYKDETLAACLALIMYEVVECPDKSLDGWTSHMKGCAAMFKLRGPNAYDTEFGHQLFLSFRVGEIQQAFAEHRRTYLADPEWLNLPFKNRPKSMFQRHLDLVAIVPNIIADGYEKLQGVVEGTVVLDPTVVLLLTLDLIDRCWKVDSQLQDFYKNLEEDTLGPIYWPELSIEIEDIDAEDELGKPFPVAFKFLDLGIAHLCLIHWSCNIILWTGMKYLYQLLAGISAANVIEKGAEPETGAPGFNINQLPPLGHRIDVATMAKNICQSVEYCLGEHHRGLGARAAIFPLKIAIEALHKVPGCELQVEWAKAAMARLIQTGVRIMNHLPISLTDPAFLTG